MKIKLFLLFAIINCNVLLAKGKMVTVSGTITATTPYCGGAAPTDDMLEQYRMPKPVPYKTIYICKAGNKKKIIKKVVSTTNGTFSVQLPVGKYDVFVAEKINAFTTPVTDGVTYDVACLQEKYNTPDASFIVSKKIINKFKIEQQGYCAWNVPCGKFNGMYPPIPPSMER